MGHIIYRHTPYVWIQDVLTQTETDCVQLLDGIRANVRRSLPRIFLTERDFLSVEAAVVNTLRPSVQGRLDRRGEGKRKNCHFRALSHPIPPAPSRRGSSLSTTPRRTRGDREKHLYGVLILWLFLQFLNFKWEYWNTDIDMKRFIVTTHHYSHRPYCY